MKKDIRMIVSDLDGTLLNKQSHISQRTYEALKKAKDKGVIIVPVSGRSIFEMKDIIVNEIKLADYAVQCCGTAVYKVAGWERTVDDVLSMDKATEIIEYLRSVDALPFIIYDGVPVMQHDCEEKYDKWDTPGGYAISGFPRIDDQIEFMKSHPGGVDVVNVLFRDTPHRDLAWDYLNKMDDIYVCSAYINELEIESITANKGKAVLDLGRKLGVSADQIIAFGDGDNDVTMIEAAGIGVAMKNGMQTPKDAADIITEYTNDEDGVARVLEELLEL